jgi:hypothetical protein
MSGTCDRCGGAAETRDVAYREHLGLVLLRLETETRGTFCRPCERETFWQSTLNTVMAGWWGLASLLAAPKTVLQNVRTYSAGADRPGPAARPRLAGSLMSRSWRTLVIAVVVAVVVWRVIRHLVGVRIDFGPQVDWMLFAAPVILMAMAADVGVKRDFGWVLFAAGLGLMLLAGRDVHVTSWAALAYWLAASAALDGLQVWRPATTVPELRSLATVAVMLWLLLIYAYFQLGETLRFFWMYLDGRY